MFNKSFKSVVAALLLAAGAAGYGMSQAAELSPQVQTVLSTFKWFNSISGQDRSVHYSENDVANHFSRDAKMITNGMLICTGIKEHYEHFRELNAHYRSMHVDIDKVDARQIGNRVYLHYTINCLDNDGQKSKVLVMGYMEMDNNKIQTFNEVIAHEDVKTNT